MPYFIDHILELPVTTTQDYSLFYILNQHSLNLWRRQIDLIRRKNGLTSLIIHPDYLTNAAARSVYRELLSYLTELRNAERMWIATPGEVNDWWRQRAQLRIVENGTGVRIEGRGSERARLAYAEEQMGQLAFVLQDEEVRTEGNACTAAVSTSR
jgi:microsomal dipeptidase-like Zn-dependent dipeptidase